ncbi:c-type cytochrome [Roseimaritima sediminicola]|uniref:c-type cytochrome n=1 Tax=Roseimaritima sediminicola TaxID=2662066 RepID=UPI001EED40C8|nr:c-type cytochrome [Roseimaritima sediminicola]
MPIPAALLLVAALGLVLSGCDSTPPRFAGDDVQRLKWEHQSGQPLDQAQADIEDALAYLFGTPDEPRVPQPLRPLVDADNLVRAAGPVYSTEDGKHFGLYREHCAVCHGLEGNGRGPAAGMQKPYPRDFRMGVFKFKSTPRGQRPTRDDLMRTIVAGEPGTAMPTFAASVPEEDREALIDYVIYLSVRGQLQRELFALAATEYDYGSDQLAAEERLFAAEAEQQDAELFAEQLQVIDGLLADIVQPWRQASRQETPVPPVPAYVGRTVKAAAAERHAASIERGETLFHGNIANCVGCHGPAGNGEATTLDFDDWTKDWTTRIGITPDDDEATEPFRRAGALRPRQARPRNLQLGAFRGGSDPDLLYLRIVNGIDGTPMPAVPLVDQPSGAGLTPDQVWDLVNYVLSLSDADVGAVRAEDVLGPELPPITPATGG